MSTFPAWPIAYNDVETARARLAPHLAPTPLWHHPGLDRLIGHGIELWVKHENHQPTGAFKVRNGLNAVLALSPEARGRGIIGATRGNHGQGLAYAGRALDTSVTICVPEGNSPAKNQAMIDLGADLVVEGADYDESVRVAQRLVASRGLTMVHSTNNRAIIAGAATITDEILERRPDLDALVVAVGGGSQAVGALTVARERKPDLAIYGVQAANASAAHDGFHAGEPRTTDSADTFADGLATRSCYEMTFGTLRDGLAGFVTATETELAAAVRAYLREAGALAEGAGAAGLAGVAKLAETLANKKVGVIISGGNIDIEQLAAILA